MTPQRSLWAVRDALGHALTDIIIHPGVKQAREMRHLLLGGWPYRYQEQGPPSPRQTKDALNYCVLINKILELMGLSLSCVSAANASFSSQILVVMTHVVVDRIYTALFCALEQTHCTRTSFCMSD